MLQHSEKSKTLNLCAKLLHMARKTRLNTKQGETKQPSPPKTSNALAAPSDLEAEYQNAPTVLIKRTQIEFNPEQPRKILNSRGEFLYPEDHAFMVDSIRKVGILQPLHVRRLSNGKFQLLDGERRLRAYDQLFGDIQVSFTGFDCIIHELDDKEAYSFMVKINRIRLQLNVVDEAFAMFKIISNTFNVTLEQIRTEISRWANSSQRKAIRAQDWVIFKDGKDEVEKIIQEHLGITLTTYVRVRHSILRMDDEIIDLLRSGDIFLVEAKKLKQINDKESRDNLIREVKKGISRKDFAKLFRQIPVEFRTLRKRLPNESKPIEVVASMYRKMQNMNQLDLDDYYQNKIRLHAAEFNALLDEAIKNKGKKR
jgi:ParB family transcriptional regulator, chromosome partitioning protein